MRLSDEDVQELRREASEGVRPGVLAERYGVSRGYAYMLVSGKARPTPVHKSEPTSA